MAEDYCSEARTHACWTRRLLKRHLQQRIWTAIRMREWLVTCVTNPNYREIEKLRRASRIRTVHSNIALVASTTTPTLI